MFILSRFLQVGSIFAAVLLTACGSNSGGTTEEAANLPETYTVSGVINNLSGTGLVLQNSGADDLAVSGTGQVPFSFPTALSSGDGFNVTILSQPSNNQVCTVTNGSGTIGNADINNVVINCVTMMTIGGTVNGLTGSGLVLQNSGADDLSISTTGSFVFSSPVQAGAEYNVSVSSQPSSPGQICSVTNGVGVIGSDVTNIVVNCVTNAENTYSISGKVNNLQGQGLVIQNQSTGESITISGKGISNFTFPTTMADAQSYSLSIATMPTSVNQTCVISSGSTGNINSADINNVVVDCTTQKYQISGSISGLKGSGMQLQINNGEVINVSNGAQAFSFTPIDDGTSYTIKVLTPPTNLSQVCSITNPGGQLNGADISNISIDCVTSSFKVTGVFNGLKGGGLQIQNFVTQTQIPLASDGSATFEMGAPIIDGGSYWVDVIVQPSFPHQQCTSTNNSGNINGADVNIVFNCVDLPTYPVGGRVSGLTGSGLVLQLNGGSNLTLNGNGVGLRNFSFLDGLPENTRYQVTVLSQPTNPAENCVVQPPASSPSLPFQQSLVTSAGVKNIFINCGMDYSWLNPTPFGFGLKGLSWANSRIFTSSYTGQLLESTDASNWKITSVTKNGLYEVAWTGKQYVAVGQDGLFTSPDNVNWTLQNTGTTEFLNSVIWTGTQLIAAGNRGTLITSPDGINWTSRNTGTTMTLNDIEWNGSTLVVVGTNVVIASANGGVSWTTMASGSGYALAKVVWTGTQFVAAGLTGSIWPYSGLAAVSTDGVLWKFTAENALPVKGMMDLAWDGSKLVAVTVEGSTATSTNGTTWTNHTQPTNKFQYVIWTGKEFVVAGKAGTVATGTNGIDWVYKNTTATDLAIRDFVYAGNLLVALGGDYDGNGQKLPLVMTSTDSGQSWTVQSTPATQWIEKAAWSGNVLVAVGRQGLIMTSTDAINWTLQTSGTTVDLLDVIWSNNLFIAYGAAGTVLTSTDGINWSLQATGLTKTIEGVAYNGTVMVAVTTSDCYLSTDSGVTWKPSVSSCDGTAVHLKGSNFISFQYNGDILESSDGSSWTVIGNDGTSFETTKDMAWNGSKLARVSSNGNILISDDFIHWQQVDKTYDNAIEWVGDKFLLGGSGGSILLSE